MLLFLLLLFGFRSSRTIGRCCCCCRRVSLVVYFMSTPETTSIGGSACGFSRRTNPPSPLFLRHIMLCIAGETKRDVNSGWRPDPSILGVFLRGMGVREVGDSQISNGLRRKEYRNPIDVVSKSREWNEMNRSFGGFIPANRTTGSCGDGCRPDEDPPGSAPPAQQEFASCRYRVKRMDPDRRWIVVLCLCFAVLRCWVVVCSVGPFRSVATPPGVHGESPCLLCRRRSRIRAHTFRRNLRIESTPCV